MARRARFDRAAWLEVALDALWEEGISGVKVEPLARRLGVTKGSFYHHFADREELLRAMVDRWQATQEGFVDRLEEAPVEDPYERLLHTLEFIHAKDARHDIAMRGWARISARARTAVESIDERRIDFVEGMFREMGFAEDEAALRARLIYFYQVAEQTVSTRDGDDLRDRLQALRYELVTRPP